MSDGYARNLLLPQKKGVEATPKNLNDLKLQKANDEKVAKENLEAARALASSLDGKQVVIRLRVGEGGKTFGSVSSKEISEAIKDQMGIEVDKKKIVLPNPLKEVGETTVAVKLHPKVTGNIKVKVEGL